MKLTEALVQSSPQVTNPLGERELDLRGVGLQHLDESVLAKVAEDFDVINLCDNQIATLDAFPKMERLTTLMVHKNTILATVGAGVAVRTPNVHTFVANGCGFFSLASLKFLSGWKQLLRVSLAKCPLIDNLAQALFTAKNADSAATASSSNAPAGTAVPTVPASLKSLSANVIFRLYLIAICAPELKLIDFERVLDTERAQAKQLKDDLLALPQLLMGGVSLSSSSVGSPSAPQFNADGTKIRKRGRERATVGHPVTAGATDEVTALTGGGAQSTAAVADEIEVTEELLAARNAALEVRLESATTEEEYAQIEIELELLDKMRQDFESKNKKLRSERK